MRTPQRTILGATLLVGALLAPASTVGAQDTGTVGATVTVANDAPCLTVGATTVTYPELAFSTVGSDAAAKGTPAYDVGNCGNVDISVLVRASNATGDGGAVWTPVADPAYTSTCETTDVFSVDVESSGFTGPEAAGIYRFLTTVDEVGTRLVPSGAITVDHDLWMPCRGSAGAGQVMSFDIVYTAVAEAPLLVTEVQQNPDPVADAQGEWVEVHNPSSSAVDIDGWSIDVGSDPHVIAHGGPLLVPPGGYVVLGNNDDLATNGGVAVDYGYGSALALSNGAGEFTLRHPAGYRVDGIAWDGGTAWPDPNGGSSMSLEDLAFDNSLGSNWCLSSETPGTTNACLP